MQRRAFLRTLLAGATGAVAAGVLPDPERLLWTPGETMHFLPPAGGWAPRSTTAEKLAVAAKRIQGEYEFRVSPDGWVYDHYMCSWQKGTKYITDQFWQEQRPNFQSLDQMAAEMWPERRAYDLDAHYRRAAKDLAARIDADLFDLWKSSLDKALAVSRA